MQDSVIRRFLIEYIKPQWKLVIVAIICTLISSACTVAVAKFVKPIIDDVFVNKDIAALSNLSIGFLLISCLRGICDYGEFLTLSKMWQSTVKKLQIRTFAHLARADLSFFDKSPCGDLVAKLTNDIAVVKNIVTIVISELSKDIFVVLGIIIVIIMQDPYFSIVAIIGFASTVLPTIRIGKKVRKISTNTQQRFGNWMSFLMQNFQGIRMIKSYSLEDYQEKVANDISQEIYELSMKSAKAKALVHPIMEVLIGIAVAIVVFVGGWLVVNGARTPGTLLSFLTAIIMVYKPVKHLANANSLIQEGLAAASRIYELLDIEPKIVNTDKAKDIKITEGKIDFNNVNFQYDNTKDNVFVDFNLTVPAKKMIALVGHSGSGKTTLINLIARFYDINSGMICIDGQDIRGVTIESLRDSISLVSQDITLFNDTIYNNIAFGKMDATKEEIANAAKLAAADEFIEMLPEKYDTYVGDNGMLLSGGQRQRISIARAILKNSPILLLDEATSALDAESEKKIQFALTELMKNKTTIVIAHRLSTILNADNIVVLNDGKIIESGTHGQLMEKNGHYARLYNMQTFG